MVQLLLTRARTSSLRPAVPALLLIALLVPAALLAKDKGPRQVQLPPDLLLEGGRKLTFERVIVSEKDIRGQKGFFKKLVDVVAGEPGFRAMSRPYSVAVDSKGRVIVTDPGLGGIHVFDVEEHKYKFLQREEKGNTTLLEPQCVAVDANDNIYVTDSRAGKVFHWAANGKYKGVFGNLKGGEGFFKRPTGIAVDRDTHEIYVTDTLRDRIYVLDQEGRTLRTIGQHGQENGEFNFPTEVLVKNGVLAVVDAMNFRVQTFNRNGVFESTFGDPGDTSGALYRPKGIGLDSENHVYLVDGFRNSVQVFDREGQLLYEFGERGTQLGQFQLPAGLFIDRNDRVYVVDSYNHRVQVFQYHALKTSAQGSKQ
jgi:DNA-binding beta-propeller fold protein YncE